MKDFLKKEPLVAILCSTYNGSKYIDNLVISLLNQSYKNWKLYLKDDCSSDTTLILLRKWQKQFPDKIFFTTNNTKNIGVVKNFEDLLTTVESDYYMFCDQDDVWLTNKIEQTMNKMLQNELLYPQMSLLIHTDLTVVDEELNVIHPSFWNYSKIKPGLLSHFNYCGICNSVTGCTAMINSKAKSIVLPFSSRANMHDWWIALTVSKYGKIDYIEESTILYRQHFKNQIGAQKVSISYFIKKVCAFKSVFTDHLEIFSVLKELGYGSWFKFYYYKMRYLILRNL